jgi:hypothetical protein
MASAEKVLRSWLSERNVQAALVHVKDDYGDYGFVGFYLLRVNEHRLEHYCFSCRTLGMAVEDWVFDRLGRPKVRVVGEVLTDLKRQRDPIDWINCRGSNELARPDAIGSIFIRGGCDMMSIAHFMQLNSAHVVGEFNIARHGRPMRLDHSIFMKYAIDGLSADGLQAAKLLGYEEQDFFSKLRSREFGFSACLFSFWTDACYALYRHKHSDLMVPFVVRGRDNAQDIRGIEHEGIQALPTMRAEYEHVVPSMGLLQTNIERIFSYLGCETTVFILLAVEEGPSASGKWTKMHHLSRLNSTIEHTTKKYPNVRLLRPEEFIHSREELIDAMHFHRMVYFRIYRHILDLMKSASTPPAIAMAV